MTGTIEYARDLYERDHHSIIGPSVDCSKEWSPTRARGIGHPAVDRAGMGQVLEWNRTALDYGAEKCLHEVFEERARRAPDRVAGVDEVGAISYGELNRRANQLGNYLRRRGVGPERDEEYAWSGDSYVSRPAGHIEGWRSIRATGPDISRRTVGLPVR